MLLNIIALYRALGRNDKGQDLIEYALLAGLISIVAVGAITLAGGEVNEIWGYIQTSLEGVPAPGAPAAP
jgi:Flp pilus assembly pilin Flp